MQPGLLSAEFISLPKTELHVHLEGSLQPETVCTLAEKYGIPASREEVVQRYAYRDFAEFIETFKWVSSLLREPEIMAARWRGLVNRCWSKMWCTRK